jgi:hypothetical protein
MLHGVWDKNDKESLVFLAKSWLRPPEIELKTDKFDGGKYVPHERAYHFKCHNITYRKPLEFTVNANKENPIQNLAFVIHNFDADITLKINNVNFPRGKNFRYGIEHDLNESRAIIWIKINASDPTQIIISPRGKT